MNQGFVRVAAATPEIKVADVWGNVEAIKLLMRESYENNVKVTVFPELCITGYTCGELFLQQSLLDEALKGLRVLAKESRRLDGIFFVGLPLEINGKLYNVAAVLNRGRILGMVPKTFLPNYAEFYEERYFASGKDLEVHINVGGFSDILVSTKQLFVLDEMNKLSIGVEICEDLWTKSAPSVEHTKAGATLIVNLSASDAITGKGDYRRELVKMQSATQVCGYVYASAGTGESTMDVVYSGHNLIAENGAILAESKEFSSGLIFSEIDVEKMVSERRRMNTYETIIDDTYTITQASVAVDEISLSRYIDPAPFVPSDLEKRARRCDEILNIQAYGLKKRLEHTHSQCAVIGISGGLDSTLALLVTVKAFDLAKIDRTGILAVTMPGFGTTDRTYQNALSLIKELGVTLKEISIVDAVKQHFKDIDHEESLHDVTYENCQARERTQILMDLANKHGGMVIGTGDMSELALGWATYNGDHMSMYGVNVSVPKTLVRHLVAYYKDTCENEKLSMILSDVLDTPVSPELLPPVDGKISQKTEDLVGPYELHDFVLYYVLRFGFCPGKIYRLATIAFAGTYEKDVIVKWMKVFYRRFFGQQFKRSCLPDGPKVGSVAVSPRGDLRMPSDAVCDIWLSELEEL